MNRSKAMMRRFLSVKLSLIVILVNLLLPALAQPSEAEVASKLWDAVGGKENWENARYFMFSCVGGDNRRLIEGERKYLWDKQTGDIRFEGMTTDDEQIVALFNLRTAQGAIFVSGQQLDNPATTKNIIEEITAIFENDAHLLFLPTVLDGERVSFTVADEKLVGTQRFTVVDVDNQKTSFETAVRGRLYIDMQTGRIQQWSPGNQHEKFSVSGFKDVGGGLVLPTRFTDGDSVTTIRYPLAAALINIESQKFSRP